MEAPRLTALSRFEHCACESCRLGRELTGGRSNSMLSAALVSSRSRAVAPNPSRYRDIQSLSCMRSPAPLYQARLFQPLAGNYREITVSRRRDGSAPKIRAGSLHLFQFRVYFCLFLPLTLALPPSLPSNGFLTLPLPQDLQVLRP